jgi:hypothetical protein
MRASRQTERSAQTRLSAMAFFGNSAAPGPLSSGPDSGCGRYRIRVCAVTPRDKLDLRRGPLHVLRVATHYGMIASSRRTSSACRCVSVLSKMWCT